MIFRPARDGGNPRFLEVKTLLLVIGTSIGLAGMLREISWLVWVGIAILLAGVALRFVSR